MIDKRYNIIYADPPWHFQNWNNEKAQTNPENHYETMSMKEIENLPIQKITADNCVLFMWCTDPLLHKQLPVVEKWGFKYKTIAFYWVKTNKKVGMKPAGGINDAKTALRYLVMVKETLGKDWLTPDLFRFGASSLANDILMQIKKQKSGAYQSADYFSKD